MASQTLGEGSEPFEIRWVDNKKGYGLFARHDILVGTRIFREWALIIDTQATGQLIDEWNNVTADDKVTIDQDTRDKFQKQTQQILDGLQNLKSVTENSAKYGAAMQIHFGDKGNDQSRDDDAYLRPQTILPMSLYKRVMGPYISGSDSFIESALSGPLHQINIFASGKRSLSTKLEEAYESVWGPNSALINHGCRPNVHLSCSRLPSANSGSMRQIGITAVYALNDIEKDQELEVEYAPALGMLSERRSILLSHGIPQCQCSSCRHEEELYQTQAWTPELGEALHSAQNDRIRVTRLLQHLDSIDKSSAVLFYQTMFCLENAFEAAQYTGRLFISMWLRCMQYAKYHNDNVRVVLFADILLTFYRRFCDEASPVVTSIISDSDEAYRGKVWNTQATRLYTRCEHKPSSDADNANVIYMLDKPVTPPGYYHLTVEEGGRIRYITFEEDQQRRSDEIASLQLLLAVNEEKLRHEAEAEAETNANELIKEEAHEQEKKARAREKAKEYRQRKKRRAAKKREEQEQQKEQKEQRQQRQQQQQEEEEQEQQESPPAPAPSPWTLLSRVPGRWSTPELPLLARFHGGTPLRAPPAAFAETDTVSDDGLEIRFGVDIRRL